MQHSAEEHHEMKVRVTGRVIRAHHDTEDVRVAIAVEEDEDELGFDEYLIADRGRGEDLEDYLDDFVTVTGRLTILETGEPLVQVRAFERW